MSDTDQVAALSGEVRPHILVNCAGVGILAALENTTTDDWDRILGINLLGPINLVRAFLPALKAGGGGHIVNIASGLGLFAFPGFGAYSTSKFALVGYSEALSVELAKYGISVTTVCPGVTETAILGPSDAGEFQRTDRIAHRLLPLIGTTPERLSSIVIDAIKRDKHLVVHTWPFRLLFLFKRLSPGLFHRFVSILYRVAMRLKRDTAGSQPSPQ